MRTWYALFPWFVNFHQVQPTVQQQWYSGHTTYNLKPVSKCIEFYTETNECGVSRADILQSVSLKKHRGNKRTNIEAVTLHWEIFLVFFNVISFHVGINERINVAWFSLVFTTRQKLGRMQFWKASLSSNIQLF